MKPDRLWHLIYNPKSPLSQSEEILGWHRCPDFDNKLIGPEIFKFNRCQCEKIIKVGDYAWYDTGKWHNIEVLVKKIFKGGNVLVTDGDKEFQVRHNYLTKC